MSGKIFSAETEKEKCFLYHNMVETNHLSNYELNCESDLTSYLESDLILLVQD
jgi:hypothetical protein